MKNLNNITKILKGGKGSGNFGHPGRPGKRGGAGVGGRPSSRLVANKQRASLIEDTILNIHDSGKDVKSISNSVDHLLSNVLDRFSDEPKVKISDSDKGKAAESLAKDVSDVELNIREVGGLGLSATRSAAQFLEVIHSRGISQGVSGSDIVDAKNRLKKE